MTVLQKSLKRNVNVILSGSQIDQVACDHLKRSLKALAERYKLGEKGTEVLNAKGKRLEDFQEWELRQYGVYCKNDVKLTYDLFKIISKGFPPEELRLIDLTLKMFEGT